MSNASPIMNIRQSLVGRARYTFAVAWACLFLATGLSGCSGLLQQVAPQKSLFGIDPGTPGGLAGSVVTPSTQPVLEIRTVRVSPPYDGTAFIYWTGPSEFELDYYNKFVASPSQLLTERLVEWFAHDADVSDVGTGSAIPPALVLQCDVTDLCIDFTDPRKPRAVLAARFLLFRNKPIATTVLSDNRFRSSIPLLSNTAPGYVAAWGSAYREILQQEQAAIHRPIAERVNPAPERGAGSASLREAFQLAVGQRQGE